MDIKFSPAQQGAFDDLSRLLTIGNIFVLYGAIGSGKSTVLGEIHRETGGAFLSVRNFVEAMRGRHPLALEETFEQMVMEAISTSDAVIVDDLNLLNDVVCCGHFYPRMGFLNAPLTALTVYAAENGKMGLYRYLLTMLDGLESQSAGRVCVMMTAMDVGNLPPAMIRSGRIELWLEMRLPDEEARAAILSMHLSQLPASLAQADSPQIVSATEGFTGADLKRLVEDGKTLYAYDRAKGRPLRAPTEYFLAAVETVRANKERYAVAEAQARRQRPIRPPWFDLSADAFTFVGEAVSRG